MCDMKKNFFNHSTADKIYFKLEKLELLCFFFSFVSQILMFCVLEDETET